MKKYVKPSINVIELQLKENIAGLPTTVYRGSASSKNSALYNIALSTEKSGLEEHKYGEDGWVS